MTLSPTDRTKINALTPNLVPNQVAASALRLAVFQEIYEYLDQIISDLNTAQGIGSVTSAKLADGSVITVKIADGAVTGPKILDGAVVEMKLATGAVTTVKLADLGVTTAKLSNLSVTSEKIAIGAVGASQLDPTLITSVASQAEFAKRAYNVEWYGAVGDWNGTTGTDSTAAIQAAIDACYAAGGGIVFIPKGNFRLTAALLKKEKVNLIGSGTYSTILTFTTNSVSSVINTVNQSLKGTNIENMTITKASSVSADITGLIGGSDAGIYNSTGLTVRNVRFYQLKYGVRGNGAPDIGIYDSIFYNVTVEQCYYGLWIHGSQNMICYPRVLDCDYGLVLDYLSNYSKAGVQVFGGVFLSNVNDTIVPSVNGTRPVSFFGTWFEEGTNPIVQIPNAGTELFTWVFEGCEFSSLSTTKLMDFSNAKGTISIQGCMFIQVGPTYSKTVTPPTAADGKLYILRSRQRNYDFTYEQFGDKQVSSLSADHLKTQYGSVVQSLTTVAYTTIPVTFTTPFATGVIPDIYIQPGSAQRITCTAASITNTGFSIIAYNWDATATVTIRWRAFGD